MRHINLHPVTERTGKIHAVQVSIRGGTGGGGNRIHGTTLRRQRVHAGIVHGTRHVHSHGSLTGGATTLRGFTRMSARLGSRLSAGALLGTHRLHRLGGSARGGDLLGTRRRRKLGHTPHHGNQRQHRHQKQHARRQAPTGTAGGAGLIGLLPLRPVVHLVPIGLLIPVSPTIRLRLGCRGLAGRYRVAGRYGLARPGLCGAGLRRIRQRKFRLRCLSFFGSYLRGRYLSGNSQRHGVLGIRRTVLAGAGAAVEAVHQGAGATLRAALLGCVARLGCAVLRRALYSVLVGVGGHARHTPTLGSRARTHEREQRTCG